MDFHRALSSDLARYDCDPLVIIPTLNSLSNLAAIREDPRYAEKAEYVLGLLGKLIRKLTHHPFSFDGVQDAAKMLEFFSPEQIKRVMGMMSIFFPDPPLESMYNGSEYRTIRPLDPSEYRDPEMRFLVCTMAVDRSMYTEDFDVLPKQRPPTIHDRRPDLKIDFGSLRSKAHDFYYRMGLESEREEYENGTIHTTFVPWGRTVIGRRSKDYRRSVHLELVPEENSAEFRVIDYKTACWLNHK